MQSHGILVVGTPLPPHFSCSLSPLFPLTLPLPCSFLTSTDKATGSVYILLEARLEALYKEEGEYEVLEQFAGKTLFGKKYTPLFDYFQHVSRWNTL